MTKSISSKTNTELIASARALISSELCAVVEFIKHLAEIDQRKLYATFGYPSLYAFVVAEWHQCEASAYRKITVARVARRFPVVLEMLESGKIHLSGLALVSKYLTPENHDELLSEAVHQTRQQIEFLLARRFPKKSKRDSVRRLKGSRQTPVNNAPPQCGQDSKSNATNPEGVKRGTNVAPDATARDSTGEIPPETQTHPKSEGESPAGHSNAPFSRCTPGPIASSNEQSEPRSNSPGETGPQQNRPVAERAFTSKGSHGRDQAIAESAEMFRYAFSAGLAFHENISRLKRILARKSPNASLEELLAETIEFYLEHKCPERSAARRKSRSDVASAGGKNRDAKHSDTPTPAPAEKGNTAGMLPTPNSKAQRSDEPHSLATLQDTCMDKLDPCASIQFAELISFDAPGKIEPALVHINQDSEERMSIENKERITRSLQDTTLEKHRPIHSRYIPASVKHEVYARDSGKCTFVSNEGKRCDSNHFLDFDHITPYAHGGVSNDSGNIRLQCRTHNLHTARQFYGEEFMERRVLSKKRTNHLPREDRELDRA